MADFPFIDPAALVWQAAAAEEWPAAAPAEPSLAMGLNGIADWTTQRPFIDVMKTARPWTGHLPGQWGGWDHAALAASGALDGAGWPKRIPPELSGISTLLLTHQPEAAVSVIEALSAAVFEPNAGVRASMSERWVTATFNATHLQLHFAQGCDVLHACKALMKYFMLLT
jgi:hypothetical protein